MQVQVQSCLVELEKEICKLVLIEGRNAGGSGVLIRRNLSRGMDGLCAVHENFHGMDLQVLRIVLLPKTLHLP